MKCSRCGIEWFTGDGKHDSDLCGYCETDDINERRNAMTRCDYCRKWVVGDYFTNDGGYIECSACYELHCKKQMSRSDELKKPEKVETLANGAKQSRLEVRMDLLPWAALLQIAGVLDFGAKKYGEDNWRGIPAESHLNHALRHIALWRTGDKSEDHLGHAGCRILMWMERAKQCN